MISGPTTGSGATLANLVTVNGNNQSLVFSTGGGTTDTVVLSGLTITGGKSGPSIGGGIYNGDLSLTVTNSTISGNSATSGASIENWFGILTVKNSTVSANNGGGIDNTSGTATIINSTISGNKGFGLSAGGLPPIPITAVLTVSGSTITGNSADGLVVDSTSTMTVTNSIIAGNTSSSRSSDCFNGGQCPTNGTAGNIVGVAPILAPLGYYGGPSPTQPPLPGSPAICAGLTADIPAGITTDQRGFPRTTTYGSNPPCVDSGAVQSNYALSFSTEPPAIVASNTNFTAAVQLKESGNPFLVSGVTIPLALGPGSTGNLSGGSAATGSTGIATYPALQVDA